jgi:cytoskeletal protein RodZ
MKRCPQCSFLYLDSDQLCDLDQTPLVADDFGADPSVIGHSEQKAGVVSFATAVAKPKRKRRLKPKTLLAAIVGGFVIGLTLLLVYQRMRPTLQASQSAPPSQAEISQASRVSQVAHQASSEAVAKAELAQQESAAPAVPNDNKSPSAEPSTSTTGKTTPNTRSDSARVKVSSNPVSTGDVSKSGRGPVTIQLANGSTLEADEVWRTKAGIWYRRKGIVTFIKPNRVRAMNH